MFNWLVSKVSVPQVPLLELYDAIIPITYMTVGDRLSKGSQAAIDTTLILAERSPNALIAFAVSSVRNSWFEKNSKLLRLPQKRSMYLGEIQNTMEEAAATYTKLVEKLGHEPNSILIVTGEIHSRRAKLIFKHFFPYTFVTVATFSWQLEIEKNHPIPFLRHKWLWLLNAYVALGLIKVLGVKRLSEWNLRQPGVKK